MTVPATNQPDDRRSVSIGDRLTAAGFGPVGLGIVSFGVVLIIAAFTELNWFRDGPGFFAGAASNSTFADIHTLLAQTQRQAERDGIAQHLYFGASKPYFSWLGWVLLLAAASAGALAVSRVGASIWAVRWLAAVIAMTGLAVTVLALHLFTLEGNAPNNADAPSASAYLSHSGVAAWAAIAGFAFILIGSLLPRRDR